VDCHSTKRAALQVIQQSAQILIAAGTKQLELLGAAQRTPTPKKEAVGVKSKKLKELGAPKSAKTKAQLKR